MSARPDASVIFRVSRRGDDGAGASEEREVHCSADTLADVLDTPWSVTPVADTGSAQANLEELSGALAAALGGLRLEVREQTTGPGDRRWSVGFVPAEDGMARGGEAPAGVEFVTPAADEAPVRMTGRVSVQSPTANEDGRTLSGADGAQSMHVLNTGLGVVNVGNLYAMINMQMNVEIQA